MYRDKEVDGVICVYDKVFLGIKMASYPHVGKIVIIIVSDMSDIKVS